jgi:sucrose-6-phosphate hydrolase SacC (GH32 family)
MARLRLTCRHRSRKTQRQKLRNVLTSNKIESGARSATTEEPITSIEILIDRGSVEIFENRGRISFSWFVIPKDSDLSVKAKGGEVMLKTLTLHPLGSAWKMEE